jgi:hypothetical protein
MATIATTYANQAGVVAVTETTLTGTLDTFTYKEGVNQTLVLRNATAGALTPIIDGDDATTIAVRGVGNIDLSGGFAVGSIAAGAVKSIRTDSIKEYLAGVIAITGGTGLVATLIEG